MTDSEQNELNQGHFYVTECNADSLPTERPMSHDTSVADVENIVVLANNETPTSSRSELTDCTADSLLTQHRVSLEPSDSGNRTNNLAVDVDDKITVQLKSDLAECNADSFLTESAMALELSSKGHTTNTLEVVVDDKVTVELKSELTEYNADNLSAQKSCECGKSGLEAEVADHLVLVVDDVNPIPLKSHVGVEGDCEDSVSPTHQVEGVNESKGHNTPQSVAASAVVHGEADQSVPVEVNVSENQSHEKNMLVGINVSEKRKAKTSVSVKGIGCDHQKGQETVSTVARDPNNHMADMNVSEQIGDAATPRFDHRSLSADPEGQRHGSPTEGPFIAENRESNSLESEMLTGALQGVYINGSTKKLCDVVVEAPPDLHRMPPLIEQGTAEIRSRSEEKAEAFSYYFGDLGLGLESSRAHAGLEQCDNEVNLRTAFYQHAYHTVVPTHCCFLDKGCLRLSDTVLQVLRQMQLLAINYQDAEQIQSSCKMLFQKYGSHVYVGDIHFGGIYSRVAQYAGIERNGRSVRQMVDATLVEHDHTSPTTTGSEEVTFWTSSTSGEQNQYSFNTWKSHLENDPTLATCIDRGRNVVGIWEVLLNHRNEFRDAAVMSEMLRAAWEVTQSDLTPDTNPTPGPNKREQIRLDPHRISEDSDLKVHNLPEAVPDLIEHLHLGEYYPEKISIRDVMQVDEGIVKRESEIADVPWVILQKLLMLDRKGITSEIKKCARKADGCSEEDTSSIDSSIDLSELCTQDGQMNPADVFLAIFLCCDLNLRQILVEKMNQCQLAFPFLFPDKYKQTLNLGLWAVRNTKLAWRNISQEVIEASAVNFPLKVVSSLRLGRPEMSKSKLLNKVIGDEEDNTFITKSAPNGDVLRVFSDGSVEGSFYLPSGKKTEILEDVAMFLNLRGDGLQLPNQVRILSQMSNVMLVFLDVSDLDVEEIRSEMICIHQHCKEVVMVLSNRTKGLSLAKADSLLKKFKRTIGKGLSKVLAFTLDGEKNEDKLKNDVRQKLMKSISQETGIRLEDQKEVMLEVGVTVDEMNQFCQEGKVHADRVTASLKGRRDVSKADCLPLQGEYWQELCKLRKRKKRLYHQTSLKEVGRMEMRMLNYRKNQDKCCSKLGPLMEAFIDGLEATIDSPSIHFYMQWLKMFFDDFSRKELHPLQQEYQGKLQSVKEAKDKNEVETIQKELASLAHSIDNANLGLEHLLREIGQIFEAAIATDNKCHLNQFCNLPNIASKLLLKGHSLEIMDGNASGVPLIWLRAVFHELQKELKDQKLFSLSVLGVQSSGKSTLLNTMFGLQLPVSAGRCTTGVYMQLLKVRDGSKLPFKYLAIFDTEGIRATERTESDYDHDNELATFVIGLGNLTLMSIKGENVSDAKDILQIAVHAFLRILMVNWRIQRDRSCVFVHQNVSAFDAKEKLRIGSQKFKETLDKNTVDAAALENIGGIHCFDQVIRFDSQRHIWYFPDLWHGSPPMASVNTGYHEQTLELKTDLLGHHAMKSQYLCDTLEVFDLIADMWNGVLADDFVFGFQNSLVAKAYNCLEEKYSELKWDLGTAYRDWKNEIQIQVKICETHENLQSVCSKLKKKAVVMINEKKEAIVTEMTKFIDAHGQKEIMQAWESQKCSALRVTAELLCLQATKDISQMQTTQEVNILQNTEQDQHKKEILSKAAYLGHKLKKIRDYSILEREFNKMWTEWIGGITRHQFLADRYVCIEDTLVALLYEHYPGHSTVIKHELSSEPFSKCHQLVGSAAIDEIIRSDWTFTLDATMINHIFRKIDSYLRTVSKSSSGFQKHDAEELLRLLNSGVREYNENPHNKIKIPKNCEVMLAVHVCAHANKVFAEAQDYYFKNYSIAAQLEKYKNTTWRMFLHHVLENADTEGIAADMVCAQLEPLITHHVQENLENAIVKIIVPRFYTKKKLIEQVLQELAEKNSCEDHKAYISEPKLFVLEWLVKYTDKHIFSIHPQTSWYGVKARAFLEEIITNIRQCVYQISESPDAQTTLGDWIAAFSQSLREAPISIPLIKREVPHICDYEVRDLEKIQKVFDKNLEVLAQIVYEHFEKKSSQTVKWLEKTPYEQILDALWGCEAVCPFCREPCMKSDPKHASPTDAEQKHASVTHAEQKHASLTDAEQKHASLTDAEQKHATQTHTEQKHASPIDAEQASPTDCHECVQHRPQGVALWYKSDSKKLVVENCNYDVQSDAKFRCSDTAHTCSVKGVDRLETYHPYKDYKEFMPQWYIRPSPDMVSSDYWKWYLCRYKTEIAQGAGLQEPDIPPSWNTITIERALESLEEYDRPERPKHAQMSLLEKIRKMFARKGKV